MADTKIEWAKKVWNPIAGCTKCSPGCENCYAERMAIRQVAMGCARGGDNTATWVAYSDAINPKTGKWSGDIALRDDQLDIPLHWHQPSRIFVCSMSDLFHEKVPPEFIGKVIMKADACPQHTFLILTKRIKRAADYCREHILPVWTGMNKLPKNIHFGVSISTYLEMWKADVLEEIPAAIRYVSLEPLLEYVPLKIGKLDWVIVGCESGPKRRPCKIEWIESIVEQCQSANVPVFVKQINVNGKVVKMPKEFPQELPERR